VVGEINAACGECSACRRGLERHCPARTVLGILGRGGAFAEFLVLPERNLLPVPTRLPTDHAVFTEPLAAAFEIAEQLDLGRFRRALVAGDGRLGLLCAHVLARAGLDVTVAGRHAGRAGLLPPPVELRVGLLEADDAEGDVERCFDLAVEATGAAAVLPRLLRRVAPRGTVILKTTLEEPRSLDLSPVVVDEITLLGSRCGAFAPALEALERGEVTVDAMIHARFPLEEGVAALRRAAEPGVLKVLLEVGEDPPRGS
jgi:threonine dehydrogenase-like Zn-dependent dehydrogenase